MRAQNAVAVQKPVARLKGERVQGDLEAQLKGERVQGELTAQLKGERVQEMLQALPAWRLANGGTALRRLYFFPDARAATAWAVYVRELAAGEKQPLTLSLAGNRVNVQLSGRPQGRTRHLTEAVFRFAALLG